MSGSIRIARRAGITRGSRVLAVGAGPGFATADLAEVVGATGEVLGLEHSARFVAAARRRCHERGLANARIEEIDLMSEQFPPTSLDAAWCRWVACFVVSPPSLIAAIAGALKPGGVAIFHEYGDYASWRLMPPRPAIDRFVAAVRASPTGPVVLHGRTQPSKLRRGHPATGGCASAAGLIVIDARDENPVRRSTSIDGQPIGITRGHEADPSRGTIHAAPSQVYCHARQFPSEEEAMINSKRPVRFPGESEGYRNVRNALLEAEIELRRNIEAVAAKRRTLPLGGPVPDDYVLAELGEDSTVRTVRLSELFAEGQDTLLKAVERSGIRGFRIDAQTAAFRGES